MAPERDSGAGRLLGTLTELPSLPKVVETLLRLPDAVASTREFADLIATDQGLAARVLRLVNSAFYSLRSPISSIRQASSLLGVRTLKSLALSVSVIQAFKRVKPHFEPVHFWYHGLAVALAASRIAQHLRFPSQDEVYIAGLLHDIGLALLVQNHAAVFAQVELPGSEGTPAALAREEKGFGQTHPEVSYLLATHWRLPPLVAQGLRHHHTPLAELPPDTDQEARRLIEVVALGDGYARRFGYPWGDIDRLDPLLPPPPAVHVQLSWDQVGVVVGDLDVALGELQGLLFKEQKEREKPQRQS